MTSMQESRGFPEGVSAIASRRIAGAPSRASGIHKDPSLGVEVVRQCRRARRAFIGPTGTLQATSIFSGHTAAMRPRILVVEDEENVAFVVRTALRLAGYATVDTTSGRDALQVVFAEEAFDLIVLDVMLPDLDGFEVCRRLRFDRSDIPVIFLTASDTVEDRVRGLSIGGDDYLTKPFSVEELVARVEAILRRSGKSTESQLLVCRDLILDDEAHQVTRGGKTVELSLTEYKLLRFLMRNAGHVMTRAQILDHVWSYDFNGESTVVETYISLLRRKVDAQPPHLIHTVRGVGYRLNAR